MPDHGDVPEEEQGQEVEVNGDGGPHPTAHIETSENPSPRMEPTLSFIPPDTQVDDPPQGHGQEPPDSASVSSSQHNIPSPLPESPSVSSPRTPTSPKPPFPRQKRSVGPSALEKVVSKTRPAYLPPKNKLEDNKHMADWERMMKQSRAAGKLLSLYFSAKCLVIELLAVNA